MVNYSAGLRSILPVWSSLGLSFWSNTRAPLLPTPSSANLADLVGPVLSTLPTSQSLGSREMPAAPLFASFIVDQCMFISRRLGIRPNSASLVRSLSFLRAVASRVDKHRSELRSTWALTGLTRVS